MIGEAGTTKDQWSRILGMESSQACQARSWQVISVALSSDAADASNLLSNREPLVARAHDGLSHMDSSLGTLMMSGITAAE
jgi:hypothetical protein